MFPVLKTFYFHWLHPNLIDYHWLVHVICFKKTCCLWSLCVKVHVLIDYMHVLIDYMYVCLIFIWISFCFNQLHNVLIDYNGLEGSFFGIFNWLCLHFNRLLCNFNWLLMCLLCVIHYISLSSPHQNLCYSSIYSVNLP